ncbi:MAG: Gfo/Idh/MocA family oxidoreductase [Candidatus Hydrogenedentes bacterium]|nr:Gfo/Idh/MocA family oxidoreductase [Candidatus Hydrogenedentota bacterium]
MNNSIGFGILGAGLVSPFHANAILHSNGGRLVAIADVDQARANSRASEFGVEARHSLEALLDDPAISVINIATPNHLHFEAVLACAQAGRHVLCEKPPAMSLAETDQMVAACKDAGVKFGCTVQCRVRDAVAAIKRAVDSGRFGQLLQADTYMKWYRPADYYHMDPWRSSRQCGAGVTIQHAFHYIDLLVYLAGPMKRVDARMTNLQHPSVNLEDTLSAFVEYESGAHGVVQATTALWPGSDLRVEIHGENGTAILIGERMAEWKFKDEQSDDEAIRRLGSAEQHTAAGGAADFGFRDHLVVVQDMIDAILAGRDVVIPVESVRHTLEVALAMYASAKRSGPVALPLATDVEIW